MSTFSEWMSGLRGRDYPHPQAITEVFGGLPNDYHPQAITEDIGGLPHESRTVTYMGRQLEIPNHWSREYVEQRTREIEEAANRYAEGLAERRREAEARTMHHMWHPSDDECNINVLPRWSFERERQLDFDPATGEITNSGGTLPNEEVLFDPGTLVDTSENNQLTTISSIEPAWELSVSDAMTDKYKEMEKRVEEQDKTIAEMKSIIENLQDIVYQRKLDKEAETLVL
jgi:hypothetical protein